MQAVVEGQAQTPPPPPPVEEAAAAPSSGSWEPLGEEAPEDFSELPPAEPPVIPFTGEEIAGGAAFLLMLGVRVQSEEEKAAFLRAWQGALFGLMPPAQVLDVLKVGEALAQYGIGKNRLPGMGSVENLPPWLRILLGGGVLAIAAYGGVRAVMDLRAVRTAGGAPDGAPPSA
ncbi:hypothetical protein TbrSNM41_05510 [Thermus brockianus]|uniref:Uncharacterized protein n=1 Tax=Thermus brockianus TaxID=56956 RepID=A0ABN6NFL9_THEBO|nr:hypothetical protein TbrSNM41_05510 [Thermus brockianus]